MDHFTLSSYQVQSASGNQIIVLAAGNQVYKRILSNAFPNHFLSRTFEDRYGRFDWGCYMHGVSTEQVREVEKLLELCSQHILLYDDLTECFALDYHTTLTPSGSQRTDIGQLIYLAKPYNRRPTIKNHEASSSLAERMTQFINNHPTYKRSEVIISAPPSRLGKQFDLPTELAGHLLKSFPYFRDGRNLVQKVRQTKPMKDCVTVPEKIANVRDAFQITTDGDIENRTVLVVDDIYQSGFTINELARVLFVNGAKAVLGLVASKTGRDM
jgi:hypothetical protein